VSNTGEQWIADALKAPGSALWWAGAEASAGVVARAGLTAFSWRVDVADALRARGITTELAIPPPAARADRMVVRMPKERALARAAIAAAVDVLPPGGELVLVGRKDEGVVSTAKACSRSFGPARIERDGPWRRMTWTRPVERPELEPEDLDPKPRYEAFGQAVHSGPGVFSWKRADPGTQRLLKWAEEALEPSGRWLDLGCGAGLIAGWLADQGAEVVATDSNLLAVAAAAATLGDRGTAVASDIGSGLEGGFDGVLCNPPFHRGFEHETSLTGRFVRGARELLCADGRAIFVVNAFVPLQREAEGVFGTLTPRFDDGRYRVVEART
jgi:16S rRNA (guanine1207-N2)-methyltransferase